MTTHAPAPVRGRRHVASATAVLALAAAACPAMSSAASGAAVAPARLPTPAGEMAQLDREPAIATADGTTVWAVADENTASTNPTATTLAHVWRSDDGGASFRYVASPFAGAGSLGDGFDVDIAVAPVAAADGTHRVYVVKNAFQGNALATSTDGTTWTTLPFTPSRAPTDRPWLAATGACEVDLVYRVWLPFSSPLPSNDSVLYDDHYDLCVSVPGRSVLSPITSMQLPNEVAADVSGRPVFTPSGSLLVPVIACVGARTRVGTAAFGTSACPDGSALSVGLSVRTAAGTWSSREVWRGPGGIESYPAVAVDAAGAVGLVWQTRGKVFFARAATPMSAFSAAVVVNPAEVPSALFPSVVADDGTFTVAYVGTQRHGDYTSTAVMGASTPQTSGTAAPAAVWSVWRTTMVRGRPGGSDEVIQDLHRGALCGLGSSGCASRGGRNLYETLQALDVRGRLVIAATCDRPGGRLADAYATVTRAAD